MITKSFTNNESSITMPLILDGQAIHATRITQMKNAILVSKITPALAIIQVGNLDESNVYIERKKNFGKKIGAEVKHIKFSVDVSEYELIETISKLNLDNAIHGIIVQLPIPETLNRQKIIDAITLSKDVDGLTSTNQKLLASNDPRAIKPATARGVLSLLRFYKIPVKGRKVTVIGRSILVGGPIATLLSHEGAIVSVCNRNTPNTAEISKRADILIVAAGSPHLVTKDYVFPGQVVIDVGINSVEGDKLEEEIPKRRLVGDVDFKAVKNIVGAISPVPGGVGPMTVLSLFENLLDTAHIVYT